MTENLKRISIPTRKLASSYKDLKTSNIFHSYKNLHEDSVREFYYIKKENFTNINEFYLASHKLSLAEYEFNLTFNQLVHRKYKGVDYTPNEIEKIFHDDMAEDEFHIFHHSTSNELYEMINYFEPKFKNKFHSIFDKNDKELVIYQGEYRGKKTNSFILFNRYYIGYLSKFI